MKRENNLKISGLLIGLSVIYFIVAMMVAEALYPGYSISNNYISDLGIGPSALIFNFSIIVLGAFLVLGAYFYKKGTKNFVLSILVAITGLSAMGVGIFNENFGIIHSLFSAAVFIAGGIAALYFSATEDTIIRYPSLALGLIVLSATVLFIMNEYLGLGPGGMERLIVYPALLWGLLFAGRLLEL